VQALEANAEEVNSLAVHARGQYLAAGDDAGDIQVRPPEARPPGCRACCSLAERTCNTALGVQFAAVYLASRTAAASTVAGTRALPVGSAQARDLDQQGLPTPPGGQHHGSCAAAAATCAPACGAVAGALRQAPATGARAPGAGAGVTRPPAARLRLVHTGRP
jgi:hypothetical protein